MVHFAVGRGGIVEDVAVSESSAKIFGDSVIEALRRWRDE
jgi:hypothetical protein